VAGAAIAHHETKKRYEQQGGYDEEPAYDEAPPDYQDQAPPPPAPAAQAPPPPAPQAVPPPADPADQIEHLAQLHDSGVLTDDEFAAAKAKALGI